MRKDFLLAGAMILSVILLVSCGDDDNTVNSTNLPPDEPILISPIDDAVGVSLTPTLNWSGSDPDDDELTYTVRFGITPSPSLVTSNLAATSYTPEGELPLGTTYYWFIIAKDPDAATDSTAIWSFTTTSDTIPTPSAPVGDTVGVTGGFYAFLINDSVSSVSSQDHVLQYNLKSSDGQFSGWSTSLKPQLRWDVAGTYEVSAQARCSTHVSDISAWSDPISIRIEAENITAPTHISGATTGTDSTFIAYSASGSVSDMSHDLEYRFDDGNGGTSGWSTSPTSLIWYTAGTYYVKAQARCVDHTINVSDWSTDSLEVVISVP